MKRQLVNNFIPKDISMDHYFSSNTRKSAKRNELPVLRIQFSMRLRDLAGTVFERNLTNDK